MAKVLCDSGASIEALPENLLLDILGYLPVKDLCTAGRVCQQWRRIARDNRLWRHVNLLPYKLNLKRTWHLMRAHFSDVLLSLRLSGNVHPARMNWKKATLSDAMLRDLLERCPNMVTLELHQTNLANVVIDHMPSRLATLIITHSPVTPGWFRPLTTNDAILAHLEVVDLSFSSKTNNEDIKHLCSRPSITTLKLNGCYRVTDDGFLTMAEKLTKLRVLCLSETMVTDLALHHISRHLVQLRHLNISWCAKVTDTALGTIMNGGLTKLTALHVANNVHLTLEAVGRLREWGRMRNVDMGILGASASNDSPPEPKPKFAKIH